MNSTASRTDGALYFATGGNEMRRSSVAKRLHWTAVIGSSCSFWLLLWLICIAAALYDLKHSQAAAAYAGTSDDQILLYLFMTLAGFFALWSGYRAFNRLSLMKHGQLHKAKVVSRTEERYHYESGVTNRNVIAHYHYMVQNRKYKTPITLILPFRDTKIDIVYDPLNPGRNMPFRHLRARFDLAANEWRAALWQVIPRAALLILIAVSILALPFFDVSLLTNSGR